jgi:hypothetical protein
MISIYIEYLVIFVMAKVIEMIEVVFQFVLNTLITEVRNLIKLIGNDKLERVSLVLNINTDVLLFINLNS